MSVTGIHSKCRLIIQGAGFPLNSIIYFDLGYICGVHLGCCQNTVTVDHEGYCDRFPFIKTDQENPPMGLGLNV